MYRNAIFLVSLLVLICEAGCATGQTPSSETGLGHADVFEKMKMLVGVYQETGSMEASARVEYKLISRGSVLSEHWFMPDGDEELTVFHMDNGILIATHYCASGVQSTMELASNSSDESIQFKIRSTTNLPTGETSHNSGFGYRLSNMNEIYRTEAWVRAEVETLSSLTLKRAYFE